MLRFAGSLLAVALIVTLTYFFGFRQSRPLMTESEARALLQLAPGGFEPVALAMDTDGKAAIARDALGQVAVLVPHGTHFVVRLLGPGTAIASEDGRLRIAGLPSLQLHLGESTRDWANTDSDAN